VSQTVDDEVRHIAVARLSAKLHSCQCIVEADGKAKVLHMLTHIHSYYLPLFLHSICVVLALGAVVFVSIDTIRLLAGCHSHEFIVDLAARGRIKINAILNNTIK